jgi:ElaB/YqjD/DUF883 family membrane-anchored ribosome-binding protein
MSDPKDKVKNAIDSGAEKAKEATEQFADKSREPAKEVGEAVHNAGEKIADAISAGGMDAVGSSAVARAAEAAGNYGEHAGELVQHGYRETFRVVGDRPVSAVLAAFGVGIVVGVVLVSAIRR